MIRFDLAIKTSKKLTTFKNSIHTFTGDNDKEFAKHKLIAKVLNIDFYFKKQYHSWERGTKWAYQTIFSERNVF